jgi:hypothetical protein
MTTSTKGIRYINLTTGTALKDYIEVTCAKAKTLKDRIQVASVGILMHVGTHNNKPQAVKYANSLIDGLGQGIQLKALVDWFVEFGMVIGEDGKGFADVNLDKVKATFQKAKATHWVSFAPATVWAGFKLDDKLEALFKAAKDAQVRAEKSEEEAQVVSINDAKLQVLEVVSNLDNTQLQALIAQMNLGTVADTETEETVTTDFTAGIEEEEQAA